MAASYQARCFSPKRFLASLLIIALVLPGCATRKESLARLALDHYARAAELDPASPDPFRQLGFLYYQQKDVPHAREAFRKYLALKPDAPDAKRIKEYLVELDR